jgi:hypothetical protein
MLYLNKLDNRICGKIPTVTSVQSCVDRKFANNTATKHRLMQELSL